MLIELNWIKTYFTQPKVKIKGTYKDYKLVYR